PVLYWAIPAGIAVLIAGAGLFGYQRIRASFRQALRSELQTLLDADKEALRIWIDSQCRTAEMLAARPAVAESAANVIAAGAGATTRGATGETAKLVAA